MANSPTPTPDSPSPTYPQPYPPIPPSTSPSTRRILIWLHEVHLATSQHPTPPLPAPQGTWRRLEKRIRGKLWTGKGSGGVKFGKSGNGIGIGIGGGNWAVMDEEDREGTRMYALSEKGREGGRKAVDEWSWDVERETESEGGERRRGDEKDARLERAAELLGRQGRGVVNDETVGRVVV